MTPSRIRELLAICEAATPGPWTTVQTNSSEIRVTVDPAPYGASPFIARVSTRMGGHADAAFIATARTALPEALREVERLRGLLREACEIAYRAIEDNAAAMPTAASARIDEIRKEATDE